MIRDDSRFAKRERLEDFVTRMRDMEREIELAIPIVDPKRVDEWPDEMIADLQLAYGRIRSAKNKAIKRLAGYDV